MRKLGIVLIIILTSFSGIAQSLDCKRTESLKSWVDGYFKYEQSFESWYERVSNYRAYPKYKALGLSDDEIAAIFGYTTGAYKKVNRALWDDKRRGLKEICTFVNVLNSGLGKLPGYQGVVWRGLKLSEKDLTSYQVGAVILFKAYTSTSKPMSHWAYEDSPVIMKIQSKNGKSISELSQSEGEDEVLFRNGTSFEVVGRRSLGDQVVIELIEM